MSSQIYLDSPNKVYVWETLDLQGYCTGFTRKLGSLALYSYNTHYGQKCHIFLYSTHSSSFPEHLTLPTMQFSQQRDITGGSL